MSAQSRSAALKSGASLEKARRCLLKKVKEDVSLSKALKNKLKLQSFRDSVT